MPVQVRLVVEPRGRRGVPGRHSVEEQLTGEVHAPAHQVLVRRHAEPPAERPGQVGRMGVEQGGGLGQGHARHRAGVDDVAQPVGEPRIVHGGRWSQGAAQVLAEALGDEFETALRLQALARLDQGAVQLVDPVPQEGIVEPRVVHRPADQARVDLLGLQVQDPLAEALRRGGGAVVGHVRR
ncbi:hypothetical protein GCM10028793_30900 [Nocardiopsis oceani]